MIACLSIPHFALTVERQRDPVLSAAPLIIYQPAASVGRVLGLSEDVAQRGVKPGMSVFQAQALAPQAKIIEANQAAYRQRLEQLASTLADFSPQVEITEAGQRAVCFLDLGLLARNGVTDLVQLLGQTVRERLALAPALGLDSGKFTAQMAAQMTQPNKARLIQPGNEAAFLAPLSINHLPIRADLKQQLHLLGWHIIGQVAAIPTKALVNQFGYEGRQLHRLANGIDERPVIAYMPKQTKTISHQAETPIDSALVLEALLNRMAGELAAQLQADGQAGRGLGLRLLLADKTHLEQNYSLSQPSNEAGRLAQTFLTLLNRCQIQTGVIEVTLTISGLTAATGQQLDLFVHQNGQRTRLESRLPDLAARYGMDVFSQPLLTDVGNDLPERRFRLQAVGGQ